jgi:hypothetical protein
MARYYFATVFFSVFFSKSGMYVGNAGRLRKTVAEWLVRQRQKHDVKWPETTVTKPFPNVKNTVA